MLKPEEEEEEEEVIEDEVEEDDVEPDVGGDDIDTVSGDEEQQDEPADRTFYKNMGWENEAEDCQVIQTNHHACKSKLDSLIVLS